MKWQIFADAATDRPTEATYLEKQQASERVKK